MASSDLESASRDELRRMLEESRNKNAQQERQIKDMRNQMGLQQSGRMLLGTAGICTSLQSVQN